jgi:hypothetical protein
VQTEVASYVSAGLVGYARLRGAYQRLCCETHPSRPQRGHVLTAVLRNAPFHAARGARFDGCAAKRTLATHLPAQKSPHEMAISRAEAAWPRMAAGVEGGPWK